MRAIGVDDRETGGQMDPLGFLSQPTSNLQPVGYARANPPAVGGSGLPMTEQEAKDWIIQRESEGKTTAQNPNSTAFGLGQMIIANRKAYGAQLGVDPNTTDYDSQSKMMDMYVKERYGSYQKAKEFWEKNNWY